MTVQTRGSGGLASGVSRRGGSKEPGVRSDRRVFYEYTDENGAKLYRVVRGPRKRFHQERWDRKHQRWVRGLGDTRRVLYNLPNVKAEATKGGKVWIAEGEKDADALIERGLVATTNPGGAGKWRDEYAESLRGVGRVVICYDLDEPDAKTGKRPGEAHALDVEKSVKPLVGGVEFRSAAHEGHKDISDHFAAGLRLDELSGNRPVVIERESPEKPARERSGRLTDGDEPLVYQLALERLRDHAREHKLPMPVKTDKGYEACCPAHDDHDPSLGVRVGDEQPLVLDCQKGCAFEDVVNALGIPLSEAFDNRRRDGKGESWQPVDLTPVLSGEVTGPTPSLLPRSDGRFLLYPGEIHSLAGEPESGKGWIALHAAVSVIEQGRDVLYLDFEDSAASIVNRLRMLGVDAESITAHFAYVRPQDDLPDGALAALTEGHSYVLAVIDGLTEAYDLLRLNPGDNDDVPKFLRRLPRVLADHGAAVLMIDHVVKDKGSRGRWPIGAQHKLAGVAVAYMVDARPSPSRERTGKVFLTLAKDRHGHIGQRGKLAAVVSIAPRKQGVTVDVVINAPEVGGVVGSLGRVLMPRMLEDVSRAVEDKPGINARVLRANVTGGSEEIDKAADELVVDGYVRMEPRKSDNSPKRFHSLKPYRIVGEPSNRE